MSAKKDGPDEESGPVQRYRFRVRTASGQELISQVASVRLPPPPAAQATEQPSAQLTAQPSRNYLVSAIFVAIAATKQGTLNGEARAPHEHELAVVEFGYELSSPRDLASGQASGKRQHRPVVITKECGPATPQLFQACITNEVFESVVLDCYGSDGTSTDALVHTVKLTHAAVSQFHQFTDPRLGLLERVSLTFEKIEISSQISKLDVND